VILLTIEEATVIGSSNVNTRALEPRSTDHSSRVGFVVSLVKPAFNLKAVKVAKGFAPFSAGLNATSVTKPAATLIKVELSSKATTSLVLRALTSSKVSVRVIVLVRFVGDC
jgi:hypothetical protein